MIGILIYCVVLYMVYCRNHNPISSFRTYHLILKKSNMTGATDGAETAHLSGAHESPCFWFCFLYSVLLIIVCLFVLLLLVIILSDPVQITASNYSFRNLQTFLRHVSIWKTQKTYLYHCFLCHIISHHLNQSFISCINILATKTLDV